jgi:kynurenine formamidase
VLTKVWIKVHEAELKDLFPETWTHFHNVSTLRLMWCLKLMGLDFSTIDQMAEIMADLETHRVLLRDGQLIKRNPRPCFP